MIFQYLRAIKLHEYSLEEDAITALDAVVDVAKSFVCNRLGQPGSDLERKGICLALELPEYQQKVLDRLYRLRCYFGAHPSPSKWWDFAEIYEYDIEESFDAVSSLLLKTFYAEETHRFVESSAKSWSQWFQVNAMMLWDAVWFEHIPI